MLLRRKNKSKKQQKVTVDRYLSNLRSYPKLQICLVIYEYGQPEPNIKFMSGLYKVERIVGKRIRQGNIVEYKVKWQNYDSSQNTWQPLKNLKNVQEMIIEFQKRNKDQIRQMNIKPAQKRISKNNDVPTIAKKTSKPQKKDIVPPKHNTKTNGMNISDGQQQQEEDLNHINSKESQNLNWSDKKSQIIFQLDELNLNIIAEKIMFAARQKQKSYKIVHIQKREPSEGDLYIFEDSQGNKQEKSRYEVLRDFSLQLIAYYQKKLKFSPQAQSITRSYIQ